MHAMMDLVRMSRCRFLLLALIVGCTISSSSALAQNGDRGRIEGRVVAESDGTPLVDVTVALTNTDPPRGTTTNDKGRFSIGSLPVGSVTLQIRHVGYTPVTRTVQIREGATNRLSVKLESTTVELAGLKISASTDETQALLPGAASYLDAAALEEMAPIGPQEALTHVPGVYGFADDGMGNSRTSVGIRGVRPRRTQRVLVLEDGMPIQPAPYVFSPLYYSPPVERIDEIEVIKGSAAVRHGPQTMAGVINYVTSRPQRPSPGGSLTLTPGTNGYVSAVGEVGGFGSPSLQPQFQVLFKRGDGFRQNNDFRQFNGTAKLRSRFGDARSLYLKLNVDYERSNATYTGLTPYSFDENPAFNPKEDDIYRIFRASLGGIYNRRYSDALQGTTRLYANVFDRPWWRETDVYVRASDYEENGAGADPVPWYTNGPLVRIGGGNEYFGNERTFYVGGLEQSFDLEHRLFTREATLEIGGRVHWERFRDNRKIGPEVGVREGVFYRGNPEEPETLNVVGQSQTYETTALALFAMEDVQWGPLRLSPGLRFEVFEQERIDRLDGGLYRDKINVVTLPGLGFNLSLGQYDLGRRVGESQFHLFGGVHRGYTPPSSATLQIVGFGPALASADEDDGLDLRSEKSWNSEIGLRGSSTLGRFEATAFHLYIEDLVGGRTVFQNLGVVQTYGLEFEGSLDLGQVLSPLPTLNGSYTFLETEVLQGIVPSALQAGAQVDISGNELPNAPTHAATVGLSKTIRPLNLTVRTNLRYRDRVYTDLENIEKTSNRGDMGPVPAHAVLDASASYQITPDVRVQLTGKNVTDNVFIGSRLHSNPRQPEASLSSGILPGPRRQINVSLKYDF